MSVAPPALSPCPACGRSSFVVDGTGGGTCRVCGYASGEGNRCPHCHATARIEGTGEAAVCAVCGGPRIPGNRGGTEAIASLVEQKKLLNGARLASLATIIQGTFAALAGLVGLALSSWGHPNNPVGIIMFALALVPLVLAIRSRSRATQAREKAKTANDRAWQAAAEEVAADSKTGITERELSKVLGIEASRAEQLLTSLAVHDRTRIDVGEDAEVRYSVGLETPSELDGSLETEERALEQKEPVR